MNYTEITGEYLKYLLLNSQLFLKLNLESTRLRYFLFLLHKLFSSLPSNHILFFTGASKCSIFSSSSSGILKSKAATFCLTTSSSHIPIRVVAISG